MGDLVDKAVAKLFEDSSELLYEKSAYYVVGALTSVLKGVLSGDDLKGELERIIKRRE